MARRDEFFTEAELEVGYNKRPKQVSGDNARYLALARRAMELKKIDTKDPQQVAQRIGEYFDFCEENDAKPNMVGMASWLGVSRSTLGNWKKGATRSNTHQPIIEEAITVLEDMWMMYMLDSKILPANAIFVAKNLFGYRDVVELATPKAQPMGEIEDRAALEARIAAELGPEDYKVLPVKDQKEEPPE